MNLLEGFVTLGKALQNSGVDLVTLIDNLGEDIHIPEPAHNNALQFMTAHDFIYGNEQDGYTASPLLVSIATNLTRDESRRLNAPDVQLWLEDLTRAVSQLRQAETEGHQLDIKKYGQQVRILVTQMSNGLNEEARELRYNLDTNFGQASSLKQKIIENKYLINKLTVLVEKLVAVNRDTLHKLAGDDLKLRTLFLNKLLNTVDRCRLIMADAIPQLERSLWSFRKQSEQAKRVFALERYFRTGGSLEYEPCHTELTESAFNHETSLGVTDTAHAPLDFDGRVGEILASIVTDMKARRDAEDQPPQKQKSIQVTLINEDPTQEARDIGGSEIDEIVDQFVYLALTSETISCIDFWCTRAAALLPSEIFLHYAYNVLSSDFPEVAITLDTAKTEPWSGNIRVYDFKTGTPQ